MSIPRETNKELIITVENDAIDVAITPPIIDAVIVSGAIPQPDPNTVLFQSYDAPTERLYLRTADGLQFVIENVVAP